MVNVPPPGRYALHKLIVARTRPVTMQSKSDKDLQQAAQLIATLGADRPGDLHLALAKRHWLAKVRPGLAAMQKRYPDAHAALQREARS